MNRLVLAFGIVCLLQGLLAEPRPEFGLTNTFPQTAQLTTVKTGISGIVASVGALTIPTTLHSTMSKLATVKTQLTVIVNGYTTDSNAILDTYAPLSSASNGLITDAFQPLEAAITTAITNINTNAGITALLATSYTGITDEFNDAFGRIKVGLQGLQSQIGAAKQALIAASAAAASATVSPSILSNYITLRQMYDIVITVKELRAYQPLVKYIVQTTIENLNTADQTAADLVTHLSNFNTVAGEFETYLDSATTSVKTAVESRMTPMGTAVSNIMDAFGSMTGISSASNGAALGTTMALLPAAISSSALTTAEANAVTAYGNIGDGVVSLIGTLVSNFNLPTDPLVNLLVDTLMGNDKYGRYCYHKYVDLVVDLFGSFDGGWECVYVEGDRLLVLQDVLLLIMDLLVFDYEDVQAQLNTCDSYILQNSPNANTGCIDQLNTYYTDLFAATADKLTTLVSLAEDEAIAILNRLEICIVIETLKITEVFAPAIQDDLEICASNGPNGSD